MSAELAVVQGGAGAAERSREEIELIKKTVAVGASDLDLKLFLYQCAKTGLDPLIRQIYWIKRGGRGTIQVGIDGYRLIADRTQKYAGNDAPTFEGDNGAYPTSATVTVWKLVGGQRCSFTATALWLEYYPGDGPVGEMWRKRPFGQLGKCAESLALRKAFPAELSGMYVQEEMDQADTQPVAKLTPAEARAQFEAKAIETYGLTLTGKTLGAFVTVLHGGRRPTAWDADDWTYATNAPDDRWQAAIAELKLKPATGKIEDAPAHQPPTATVQAEEEETLDADGLPADPFADSE